MHIRDIKGKIDDAPTPDADAYGLLETDMYVHEQGEKPMVHRIQLVWWRFQNEQRVQVRDLSAEGVYSMLDNHPPMRVYSGVESTSGKVEFTHKVGEVMEIADAARDRKKVRETLARAKAESTLFEDAQKLWDKKQRRDARIIHFGPGTGPGRASGTQ